MRAFEQRPLRKCVHPRNAEARPVIRRDRRHRLQLRVGQAVVARGSVRATQCLCVEHRVAAGHVADDPVLGAIKRVAFGHHGIGNQLDVRRVHPAGPVVCIQRAADIPRSQVQHCHVVRGEVGNDTVVVIGVARSGVERLMSAL